MEFGKSKKLTSQAAQTGSMGNAGSYALQSDVQPQQSSNGYALKTKTVKSKSKKSSQGYALQSDLQPLQGGNGYVLRTETVKNNSASLPSIPLPTKPTEQAEALYDYTSQDNSTLSFKKGDKINISEKTGDWWMGELKGKTGYVPSNFIQLLTTSIIKPLPIVSSLKPVQDDNTYWQNLSQEKGIPLVEGQGRDRKADYELLSKLTAVSKLTIGRFLGEMIEELPLISKACFDLLNAPDPFESNKCFKDTFEILVVPSRIRRTKEREWLLDSKGNLIPDPKKQEKTLDIPLNLKNLRILCSSPLDGKKTCQFSLKILGKKHLTSVNLHGIMPGFTSQESKSSEENFLGVLRRTL